MYQYLDPNVGIQEFLYPLLGVSNDTQLIRKMTLGVILYSFIVLFLPKAAPYGRYSSSSFGPGIPANLAWCIQESPSFIIPLLMILKAPSPAYVSITNQILMGLFMMHYFQRSFIYPLLVRSKNRVPFIPFFGAFLTCTYNGVLHGVYFTSFRKFEDSVWLYNPVFWVGIAVYLVGMKINIGSDSTLRRLRSTSDQAYSVPLGGMFEYVSCANYLGEIVEMWGYAIACCSPPAVAHALFTSCFLIRRATHHHEWYKKKFDDYPRHRRAIIPYLI